MLKYDQWSHQWECVLTASQKCKADSNDYDYTTNFLSHTQIPNHIQGLGMNTENLHQSPKGTKQSFHRHQKQSDRALEAQRRAKGVVLGLPLESKYN